MNYYTSFEIKLIYRNKKLRQILFLTSYWIAFTYLQLLTNNKLLLESLTIKLIYYPLLISLPGVYYAQYFSSIEANYVNKLFTLPSKVKSLLYHKYMLYCALSLVITLLFSPTLAIGITPLELLTYYVISIGPILFIAFQSSRWTSQKIDLSMSAFMNWQGNNITHYGLSILLLALFFCITAVISLFFPPHRQSTLCVCLLGLSSVFVVTHRIWLSQLAQNYINNKYKNIKQSDED